MLTKVRLVLLALLLVGSYAATPQAVNAMDVSPTAAQYEFTQNYTTDLVPGSGSGLPDPFNPTAIGNALYFQSNRGLVRANESGASEIRTSTDERLYSATNFVWFQNKVYFTANDAIWSTDGNTATLAADLWPGESGDSSSYPDLLTVVGDWLYFRAASPETWVQLWRTNGNTVEQISFTCIGGAVCDHDPENLTPVGAKVLFTANDGSGFNGGGYGIWSYDGETVSKIWAGPSSAWASPTGLVAQGGKLYFAALSAVGSDYLQGDFKLTIWQTDGTEAGTAALAELPFIATEQGACSSLVFYQGALYLCAVSVEYDAELWSVDIATGATNLVSDINATEGSWPGELTVVDNKLYFTADSDYSTSGRCLYELSLAGLSCITSATPQLYAHTLSAGPDGLSFVAGGKLWMHTEGTLQQVTPNSLSLGSLTWLSDSTVAASVWSAARGRELLVGTVSTRMEQAITFASIPNRTTGQPLTFAVTPAASSGLMVSLSASGACEVSGFMVSVLDKGTCTLTATQDGDESWTPAEPVIRSFTISRVLLSNKTVTFLQWDGKPAVGIGVNWRTPDGTYRSNYQPLYLCYSRSKCPVTNSKGQITFAKIPGGAIDFEVTGTIGVWQTSGEASDRSQVKRATVGPSSTSVLIGPGAGDQPVLVRVRVILPSGAPVPGAAVEYGSRQYQFAREDAQCTVAGLSWNLSTCVWRATTNSDGVAVLRLPASTATYLGGRSGMGMVHARFTDDILSQMSAAINLTSDGAEIVLEDLPVVDIEQENMTVNLGVGTAVTAVARDESGSPLAGQKLTLKSSVTGAAKSCAGAKTVSTTNSLGVATFKVCPIKSATWAVDGKAIVGSAGVRLTVQLTPTAPRTLVATAKTRSVSLAWVVPVKANASAVTDYIVQYRLQGATSWITFRDGTSTSRKANVTGLASGQLYEFRVAAKNKAGTGTWSDVVLGTAN